MNADKLEPERGNDGDSTARKKLPGSDDAGVDDSIPRSPDGVGLGAGTEANTFEPEEDPDATREGEES